LLQLELEHQSRASSLMRSSYAVLLAVGLVLPRRNRGSAAGPWSLLSLEPGVEAGTIAAGEVGATAALTRNPDDVRKIAANNTKAIECASSVLMARADETSIRFLDFYILDQIGVEQRIISHLPEPVSDRLTTGHLHAPPANRPPTPFMAARLAGAACLNQFGLRLVLPAGMRHTANAQPAFLRGVACGKNDGVSWRESLSRPRM